MPRQILQESVLTTVMYCYILLYAREENSYDRYFREAEKEVNENHYQQQQLYSDF